MSDGLQRLILEGLSIDSWGQLADSLKRSVSIEIYDDGAGKWQLEVVDEFNNSTVWEGAFDTDDMALKEALDTIEEEGIQALIGSPPDTV